MYLFKRNEVYYIQYTTYPRNHVKRISTKCRNKTEALEFLSNFKEEVEGRKRSRTYSITLDEYISQFMNYSKLFHKPPTQQNYLYTLKEFMKDTGNIPLDRVNGLMISEFLCKRLEGSIYRAEQSQTYLLSFFNKAISDGHLFTNPVKGIKKIKRPVKMPLFFREQELQALLDVVDDGDLKDVIRFAVLTGLRRTEILTLEWYQIHLNERILILDNIKYQNKGKKVSTLPLNKAAMEILSRRFTDKKSEFVFTQNNKRILPDHITKVFKKYIIASNVNPNFNFHSLRHTFASWLVQRNVPIQQVKELLRHSDIKTTLIYAHLKPDNLREAIELLS